MTNTAGRLFTFAKEDIEDGLKASEANPHKVINDGVPFSFYGRGKNLVISWKVVSSDYGVGTKTLVLAIGGCVIGLMVGTPFGWGLKASFIGTMFGWVFGIVYYARKWRR